MSTYSNERSAKCRDMPLRTILLGRLAVIFFAFTVTAMRAQPACKSAPIVAFATYLGGSANDHIRDVATDESGNVYITGATESPDFPSTANFVAGGTTEPGVNNIDIFVSKLDPSGKVLWSTRIGGPNHDRAYAIEVDAQGFVVVAGRAGRGFPVSNNAFQTTFKGGHTAAYGHQDGIVLKLSPDGREIVWASYFGTEDERIVRDVALDLNGDVFIASSYQSGTYVSAVAGAFRNKPLGGSDGVLAKVAADGSRVLWAWYIGGSGSERGGEASVRLDGSGNTYYLVETASSDALATPTAYQRRFAGGSDFYLTKWSNSGSVIFATYLGGSAEETYETHNLALDSSGNAYIAAATFSRDFPTTIAAYDRTHNGVGTSTGARTASGDAFIAKISANGSRLMASSFYGGRLGALIQGIAVDNQGYVHVTGGTVSDNLAVSPDAYQSSFKGSQNSFYAVFSSDLSTLAYATYAGGSQAAGRTLAVDHAGAAYFGGETNGQFPVQNAIQTNYGGTGDAFLVKISPGSDLGGPCLSPGSIVNAGSYLSGIVPGGLATIFGTRVLRGITGTVFGGGSTSVQGTRLSVAGVSAPILSLTQENGRDQINFQAPFELTGLTNADIEIESNGTSASVRGVPVLVVQPGIFEWYAPDGSASAATIHADGSLVNSSSPARRGEIVSLFVTGAGPLTPAVATGAIGPIPPAAMEMRIQVEVAGSPCEVLFSGYAPGFLGLYQVNFRVRDDAPSGVSVALTVRIGNTESPRTLIAF